MVESKPVTLSADSFLVLCGHVVLAPHPGEDHERQAREGDAGADVRHAWSVTVGGSDHHQDKTHDEYGVGDCCGDLVARGRTGGPAQKVEHPPAGGLAEGRERVDRHVVSTAPLVARPHTGRLFAGR